jgi:hypothetical protein
MTKVALAFMVADFENEGVTTMPRTVTHGTRAGEGEVALLHRLTSNRHCHGKDLRWSDGSFRFARDARRVPSYGRNAVYVHMYCGLGREIAR